jgi:hypothetical protein
VINGRRIAVVLPAYNAAQTLASTVREHDRLRRLRRGDRFADSRRHRSLRRHAAIYKYVANRGLIFFQNLSLGAKLSEYHTGYRAYRRRVMETLPLGENSDDFVFDNQVLAQCVYFGFRIGEVSCPTKYFPEASSINFRRSVRYGLGVLTTTGQFVLQRLRIARFAMFDQGGVRVRIRQTTR